MILDKDRLVKSAGEYTPASFANIDPLHGVVNAPDNTIVIEGDGEAHAEGGGGIAIGVGAQAKGIFKDGGAATAIGYEAEAEGAGAIALGDMARVLGDDSMAYGA
ncbi:hypothetical protein ACQH8C_24815, partial [Escherichia coli]